MGRKVDKRIREWIGKNKKHSVGKRNVFVSTGMEEKKMAGWKKMKQKTKKKKRHIG